MTWTRLTDTWVDDPAFHPLDLAARWHYLALIQWCSRNNQYDGVMRLADARRASDVDDPIKAIGDLIVADLLANLDGAHLRVVRIDEHVLPPYMRDPARKERQRTEKRRSRLHAKGDHSDCLSQNCPKAVSADVSTDTGTGRDGPGQEAPPLADRTRNQDEENARIVAEFWGQESA